jgi:hypothetical protein
VRLVQNIRHEVALRVIGQDLATFVIDSLEITLEGEDFVTKGVRIAHAAEAPRENGEKPWAKLLSTDRRGNGIRYELTREPFSRKYTPDDVKNLDEIGKSRRKGTPEMQIQHVLTLDQSLRIIGRMVDSSGGRLIKLVKNQDNFALEYQDADGVVHKDEHSSLLLARNLTEESLREMRKKEDPWSKVEH